MAEAFFISIVILLTWSRFCDTFYVGPAIDTGTATTKNIVGNKNEILNGVGRLARFASTLLDNNITNNDILFASGAKAEIVDLEIDKIIPRYGYSVETYYATTEDGYVLKLFRIPSSGQPVFLMHGLLLSADDWVTAGPESGMAYLLANEGFDVWLGNARGSKHSRQHRYLSPEHSNFWNFSWDEIGRYDLPTMIDFVLNNTCRSELVYIGHSQGTTAFFVMTSERPEYNNKISLMIALAPATAIPNLISPLLLFVKYASFFRPDIPFNILRKLGLNELTIGNASKVLQGFAAIACPNFEITRAVCSNLLFLIAGINYNQLNISTLPVILSHMQISGVAVKQIEHYAQTVSFGKFQRFSYGAKINKELYGTVTPPEYNIGAITTPVAMFYSKDDWLASERDSHVLRKKLNNVVDFYLVPDDKFKHLDFVYSKNIKKHIFLRILNLIDYYVFKNSDLI